MRTKLNLFINGSVFQIGTTTEPVGSSDQFIQAIEAHKLNIDYAQITKACESAGTDKMILLKSPEEILKIILAKGFPIASVGTHLEWLNHYYLPVEYLVGSSDGKKIQLGYFYRMKNVDADDQFPLFCKLTDYPPEFQKYFIELIIKNGGRVIAKEPNLETILLEPGFDPRDVFGREQTIRYMGYKFIKAA